MWFAVSRRKVKNHPGLEAFEPWVFLPQLADPGRDPGAQLARVMGDADHAGDPGPPREAFELSEIAVQGRGPIGVDLLEKQIHVVKEGFGLGGHFAVAAHAKRPAAGFFDTHTIIHYRM